MVSRFVGSVGASSALIRLARSRLRREAPVAVRFLEPGQAPRLRCRKGPQAVRARRQRGRQAESQGAEQQCGGDPGLARRRKELAGALLDPRARTLRRGVARR